jgi:hypothetical protein
MINVSRFGSQVDAPCTRKKFPFRKAKSKARLPFHIIGVDANSFWDSSGQHQISDFREIAKGNVVTLTLKEAMLILKSNPDCAPPMAIEAVLPWLPRWKDFGDSQASYSKLQQLMRHYVNHIFLASDYCDQSWNKICNSIRITSNLDSMFYGAWHLPIQEAFILEEKRSERVVFAIDINAMYPSCTQYDFPHPGSFRVIAYHRNYIREEHLPVGLYNCTLRGATSEFIKKYNPFRSFCLGKYYGASLSSSVEVKLNEFEVSFFSKHFAEIYLGDGVVSDVTIKHPLAKEMRRAYARRRNYQAQGNKALEDREKFAMVLMASCANRPTKLRVPLPDGKEALRFIYSNYGISRFMNEPTSSFTTWLDGRKGIKLHQENGAVAVTGPCLDDGSACFSLSQRIVARGRVMLLELMERVLLLDDNIEICYCNIDSVHFSAPKKARASIESYISKEISQEMGSFKIEAVTDFGLWLEPGRYWLYSDRVVKFRNRGIGSGGDPFRHHRVHHSCKKIGGLYIPVRAVVSIGTSCSDAKDVALDSATGLLRQIPLSLSDGMGFFEVLDLLSKNRKHAHPAKLQAFGALRKLLN